MFEQFVRALEEGKLIAITCDRKTGEIKLGGVYTSERVATLDYSADSPEGMEALPQVVFIRGEIVPPFVSNNM